MLNASLASSRRPCSVQLLNSVSQLQWRHLKGGATWHAPPMSPLHCDSVVVQNAKKWNFDYSGNTFTYDF